MQDKNNSLLDVAAVTGTDNARLSLSALLGEEVVMGEPDIDIGLVGDLPELLGGNDREICAVIMEMRGDLPGAVMLTLDRESSVHILRKSVPEQLRNFGESEDLTASALEETGNILLTSFVDAFIEVSGFNMELTPPGMSYGPCGAVLDCVMASYERMGGNCLLVRSGFYNPGGYVSANIVMLPFPEAMGKFEAVFGAG